MCGCAPVCLYGKELDTVLGRKGRPSHLTTGDRRRGDPNGEWQQPAWSQTSFAVWCGPGIAVLPGGGWLLLVDYSLKRCALVPCCYAARKSSVILMRFLSRLWKEERLLIRLVVIELPNHRSLSQERQAQTQLKEEKGPEWNSC